MSKSRSDGSLTRKRQSMPSFVREAIKKRKLSDKYKARPAYQRNDYLMWIGEAKRDATKQKRLAQMLDELKRGGVYMRMKWSG
jgi:uncharacterized protein YdeI (YjbR/CyaY-like superfamily)